MGLKEKKIFSPLVAMTRWLGRNHPETLVRIRYFARFHKFLNLKNPKTLNEKIQYLSFRTDTSRWTPLSDKHAVREYIKEKGLEDILIPQFAHYTSADQIDFSKLPSQFVIKTTHGSGDVLIVNDKSKFDQNKVRQYFAKMLKHKYGELEGGQHYMRLTPGITVEALLEIGKEADNFSKSLVDYKFWCFNGEPQWCWICYNRDKHNKDTILYDNNWNPHFEYLLFPPSYSKGTPFDKPKNFERMLEICRILSNGFPCVRVDLYNIDGKIYFGELTFTSHGGMMVNYTSEWLLKTGSEVKLPGIDY